MKEPVVYRNIYEVPANVGTKCTKEEDKTRQSDRGAGDINEIIKKFEVSGLLPGRREGFFADVSAMPSYQEALAHVSRARETFMRLPPEVRAVFDNDPARLLDAWNQGEHGEIFERIGWLERVQDPQLEKAPAEAPGVKAPEKAPAASRASA